VQNKAPFIATLFAALMLAACSGPPELAAPEGVELTPIRTISRLEQRLRLWRAGISDTPVRYDIDCYRMVYRVRLVDGREELASGLLALPRGAHPQTLVSWQHGTTATRTNVPSTLKVSGRAAMLAFAGAGYALIAPDYLGLGVSEIRHPYLIADPQARTVVSMIEAARRVEGVPNGPVFLTGHSEGGHASLAAMRMLEASGEEVLAAAPVAGAYELRGLTRLALTSDLPIHSFYLAYTSWAYADHYNQPLDTILTRDAARRVLIEFGALGATTNGIGQSLPPHARDMLAPAFAEVAQNNGAHWFLDAMGDNSVTDWTPRAPIRFYYGNADTEVPPAESRNAAAALHQEAIDLGQLEHDPALAAATPRIIAWLDELERSDR
jgi:pimeloyl-ACP methyl ester carboxylesterase